MSLAYALAYQIGDDVIGITCHDREDRMTEAYFLPGRREFDNLTTIQLTGERLREGVDEIVKQGGLQSVPPHKVHSFNLSSQTFDAPRNVVR